MSIYLSFYSLKEHFHLGPNFYEARISLRSHQCSAVCSTCQVGLCFILKAGIIVVWGRATIIIIGDIEHIVKTTVARVIVVIIKGRVITRAIITNKVIIKIINRSVASTNSSNLFYKCCSRLYSSITIYID